MTYPKVDANGRMSTQEIVKLSDNSLAWQAGGWKKHYKHLHDVLHGTNNWRTMRSGNSLFILRIIRPHEAQIYTISADNPNEFLKHFNIAIKCILHAGFNWFMIISPSIMISKTLEGTGLPVSVEAEKGQYRNTVDLRSGVA